MVIYPMDSSLRSWRDWQRVLLFFGSRAASRGGGGGVLPNMGYIGMCGPKG